MLYERWRELAGANRQELALLELSTGRRWTFGQLRSATEQRRNDGHWLVHPQGQSAEFVLEVLRGWRNGRVVCPLEPGQTPPKIPRPPKTCLHLKTTSATTGKPRLVAFTTSQLAADADHIVATMGLRADWPNLGVISLAHSYGFSNLVLPLLLHGIPLVLGHGNLPEAIRQAGKSGRAWTLPAVPALWRAWQEAAAIPPNLRLAISAGAPLSAALEQAVYRSAGLKVHNFYGATECGGIAYDREPTPRSAEESVGSAMHNVRLAVNAAGCLEVRGPNVGHTYWPEPESSLADGCFRTSDLAELRDGQVFLRGRATDLLNIAGRKVAPETIERVLALHPAVKNCLVLGLPGQQADRGEIIAVIISRRGGASVETFRTYAQRHLPAWQVPREWWLVDRLEPDPRGKLSRSRWREKFLARLSSPQKSGKSKSHGRRAGPCSE